MQGIVWFIVLVLISAILGAVAFFMALGSVSRFRIAEERLLALEVRYAHLLAQFEALRAGAAIAQPSEPPAPTEAVATPAELAPSPGQTTPVPLSLPQAAQPQARGDLEQRLGSRWAVWVGGLALALGGLFLVRYSIEQGWIGPAMRVAMGAMLAAALVAAGEWLRRRSPMLRADALSPAYIPGVLMAAGVITAFGVIYAAHALYGFIGPAVAFILLGAAGAAAMLASALHGPALAGLGLAGSFVTPLLVTSDSPNPWPVVLFLAIVAAAAMALARLRGWLWLATTTVTGALLWGLALTSAPSGAEADWTSAAMTHAALQTLIAAFFMGALSHGGVRDGDARVDWTAFRALASLTILALVLFASDYSAPSGWVQFAAAMIFVLSITADRAAPVASAAALSGVVLAGALGMWPIVIQPAGVAEGLAAELPQTPSLQALPLFIGFGFIAAISIAAVMARRLYASPALHGQAAAFYAGAAVLTPLVALIIAYLQITRFEHSEAFALCGGMLALAFTLVAQRFDRAEGGNPDAPLAIRLGTGAFAAGAVAAFAFALICFLERGYLTVALALAALGAAYVASARNIPMLRYAVAALGFAVLGRLIWDPRIMGDEVGATPVFNWLLFGYGVPALSFALSARLLRDQGDDAAVRISDALSVLFAALLFFFQIRHALHGGDPLAVTGTYLDEGLLALTSLGFSYVLLRADAGRPNSIYRSASMIFGVAATVMAVLGLGVSRNPLFTGDLIYGPAVFNSLALAYLLPAAMAGVLARAARSLRPAWYVRGAAIVCLGLLFAYISLEVRHLYKGEDIVAYQDTSAAEQWTYSIAWLMLGLACLGYGVILRSQEARLASAVFVVLTVLKVFLLDMSALEGVWRAFSFIALGLALMGIGLVYQRFLMPPNADGGEKASA